MNTDTPKHDILMGGLDPIRNWDLALKFRRGPAFTLLGMNVVVDPAVALDEIRLEAFDGRVISKITGIKPA